MSQRSIDRLDKNLQASSEWNFELKRFVGKNIFCPMCSEWHENNSFCQMNLLEDQGGSHEIF